jgi:hypothetical protein
MQNNTLKRSGLIMSEICQKYSFDANNNLAVQSVYRSEAGCSQSAYHTLIESLIEYDNSHVMTSIRRLFGEFGDLTDLRILCFNQVRAARPCTERVY